MKSGIKKNDRVSHFGSWRCGTVIKDWGDSCLVDWDNPYRENKKTSYEFKERLVLTTYYNECWGAWKAQNNGIPTVAPKWQDE